MNGPARSALIPRALLALALLCGAAFALDGVMLEGVVRDSSFAPGEEVNVEILESGEAVRAKVGEPFSVLLPADTLWNVCVTDSDTSGGAKEKCFLLSYAGPDSSFGAEIGGEDAVVTTFDDGTTERIPFPPADSAKSAPDTAAAPADDLPDVEALLAAGEGKRSELKKVVVQLRRRPKRQAGESVVTAKAIKRMPGLGEADVIRSIQALPGVVASSDFSTKIYVRGGAADQNLFLYDNAVVYSPTHFFGLFSTFLVEGIDGVQFYKSGFPAQYGNRLSSVLKMDGRAGGRDSVEEWFSRSSVKISTFAAQLHTEGHKRGTRWVFAGRSTYIGQVLDFCNWAGLIDFDLDYEFTDLQGTVVHEFSPDTRLKASFYVGKDVLAFDPLYVDWGNVAVPINFFHRFGDWEYNATLAFSRFYQNMEIVDLLSIGMDLYTWQIKQWLDWRGLRDHVLTVGHEAEYDDEIFFEYIANERFEDKQRPWHHVLYLQDAWSFAPRWTLRAGLRLNYQTAAEHFGVEPRGALVWAIDPDRTLEFHAGHYLQYMNSVMFSDAESLNEFYYPATTTTKGRQIEPSRSNLYAVEYSRRNILEEYDFAAGVYWKTQNNLNTFVMTADSSSNETASEDFMLADWFGTAEGYSMGYELSLRKDRGALFGGVNWSQSLSVLRTDDGSKPYFPSWHQPYALKFDAGINWKGADGIWPHRKKGRYLRSSLALKYSAGMPFTESVGYFAPHSLAEPRYEEKWQTVPGSRNAARQSDYFRIDLKAIDVGREDKWNFSWTIINLTDHENMFYTWYDTRENPPVRKQVTQFPFLPIMLNYEYVF